MDTLILHTETKIKDEHSIEISDHMIHIQPNETAIADQHNNL